MILDYLDVIIKKGNRIKELDKLVPEGFPQCGEYKKLQKQITKLYEWVDNDERSKQ